MKKTLLLAILTLFAVTAVAQAPKRVAVLKTVDRTGTVPHSVKMQLRNSMVLAISKTPGYECFEGLDMTPVADEPTFVRTGTLKESQIKKLGEISGAAALLVTEVSFFDENNVLLMAKILDVETACIVAEAPAQVAATNPDAIKQACNQMASKLFGNKR